MAQAIKDLLRPEAVERLRIQFGNLTDIIGIEIRWDASVERRIIKLCLEVRDSTMEHSPSSTMEREIGVGLAEIRRELYRILEIGQKDVSYLDESQIRLDNKLPTDIVLMHSEVYAKLKGYGADLLEISRILKRRK